ncbi:maltokinase N-terminal cap-like domain-containing protein [Streptomyces marincola]|uniref:maltokinase N-terminal cap-like domain-containing protein n=1 Tax=Streptomyces marincola TaxID=2878388 RepID=UPI00131C76C4|nr:hypothetical protein [Streptomyces marincola]
MSPPHDGADRDGQRPVNEKPPGAAPPPREAAPLPARLPLVLAAWLPRQRWFAAKGRVIDEVAVEQHIPLDDRLAEGGCLGLLLTLRVAFADGGPAELYQVPIGLRSALPPALEPAVIAALDGLVCYDALADPEITAAVLHGIATGRTLGDLRLRAEPGAGRLPASGTRVSRPLGVEQSNSSVVLDERYLLKFFRRLQPGVNQELELPRALLEVGGAGHVPAILGSAEGTLDGRPVTYAVVQHYVANAADGWSMALGSVRDLLAGGQVPDQAGGDFASEARRLGHTVAEVHDGLARARGTRVLGREGIVAVVGEMRARLEQARRHISALDRHAGSLDVLFTAVESAVDEVTIQRVHGDLHLGQVLRTPTDWLLVDFEGEPAATQDERLRMRSPLRDVAGMLRSFDYAAHHQFIEPGHPAVPDPAAVRLADEWSRRSQAAFCEGYAERSGADPRDQPLLLRALLADKAVYEAVYESRWRPHWASLPVAAVRRYAREIASGSPRAHDFF